MYLSLLYEPFEKFHLCNQYCCYNYTLINYYKIANLVKSIKKLFLRRLL